MTELAINPRKTALVLIDLQHGILGRPCAPHSSADVIRNAVLLADKFRSLAATVVLVHVGFHADAKDRLNLPCDAPMQFNASALPANWMEIVPELGPQKSDLVILKRQWGAFYGTDLDLQLRRREVNTIVLGGIATNLGVESTAAMLTNGVMLKFLSRTPCPRSVPRRMILS